MDKKYEYFEWNIKPQASDNLSEFLNQNLS